jgi:hypothetical protein
MYLVNIQKIEEIQAGDRLRQHFLKCRKYLPKPAEKRADGEEKSNFDIEN